MKIFVELEDQYNSIDKEYASIEFNAGARGWIKKEATYRRKRELNDQAYFLFMFSRLEDLINQESKGLIEKKKLSKLSWKQKAPWNNLPCDVKKIDFKNRLALLVEKGNKEYNLTSGYYKERNSIAHGGNFLAPISMPLVIANFKSLYKAIKT